MKETETKKIKAIVVIGNLSKSPEPLSQKIHDL